MGGVATPALRASRREAASAAQRREVAFERRAFERGIDTAALPRIEAVKTRSQRRGD
jgi:hypothetical protein